MLKASHRHGISKGWTTGSLPFALDDRCGVTTLFLLLCFCLVVLPSTALAQDRNEEGGAAESDSLDTDGTQTNLTDIADQIEDEQETGGYRKDQVRGKGQRELANGETPFIISFINTPKAGIRTNATTNRYYGDFNSILNMFSGSKFTNRLGYSWTDFRQQTKTTEKREANSSYNSGTMLPVMASVSASWNWTEDRTTNAAGYDNISKRDYMTGGLVLSKPKLTWQGLNLTMKGSGGANDQKAVNQNQRNDVSEAYLDGGMQLGTEIAEGLSLAGRLFGRATDGDRSLGDNTAPSSSTADTLGIGVYYNRNFTEGRVELTRGNFDRKYLDYKRNTGGLIDTVGLDEDDKVVDEMEIKDILTLELTNNTRVLGMYLDTKLSHSMDESDFAISKAGFKEKLQQEANFTLGFSAGRDSFSIGYAYLWKWDDQLTKDATVKRGRQYSKERDLDFYWGRTMFKETDFSLKYHTGLGQDTAENSYVNTDKDRLRYDLAVRVERNWVDVFRTTMMFSFKQNQDLALHETRSANNNLKDSWEISPGYSWPVSPWLTFSQNYRVYIQYTDYAYSHLEGSNRTDNYNKRGNLSTVVKLMPTSRLDLTIKHDYNKRFNADKTNEGSAVGDSYFVYQRQKIGKIDLAFVFRVANGVTLEGATYRTKDEKTSIGTTDKITERLEGKIWVGAKVNRKWGKDDQLELSAMVKKYNAYGPSISEASSDYWETDVWLKWEF